MCEDACHKERVCVYVCAWLRVLADDWASGVRSSLQGTRGYTLPILLWLHTAHSAVVTHCPLCCGAHGDAICLWLLDIYRVVLMVLPRQHTQQTWCWWCCHVSMHSGCDSRRTLHPLLLFLPLTK